MMKLLVLALVVPTSALVGKKAGTWKPKQPYNLKEVVASTTREGKPWCTKAGEMQEGKWVALQDGEYQEAPDKCNPDKMMWEPNHCKLPYHSDDVPKGNGRVVFMGDSITDNAARSFAWFYDKLWAKQLNACQYTKDDVKAKLSMQLHKHEFKQAAIQEATTYVYENGFRKNHHWWGCNSSVMYVPVDQPPNAHAAAAFLSAVKNFPTDKPLGPEDTIVLNWGAWEKDDQANKWPENFQAFMKEYKALADKNEAPKLIYREMSPMHWGGGKSNFDAKRFNETQVTQGCSPLGGEKQLNAIMKRETEFPLSNSLMWKGAAKIAHVKIDDKNVAFLPVWRGSAERFEDHQLLSKYQKETGATIDCTHFCVHGNVHRFWNSAIVATMAGMNQK